MGGRTTWVWVIAVLIGVHSVDAGESCADYGAVKPEPSFLPTMLDRPLSEWLSLSQFDGSYRPLILPSLLHPKASATLLGPAFSQAMETVLTPFPQSEMNGSYDLGRRGTAVGRSLVPGAKSWALFQEVAAELPSQPPVEAPLFGFNVFHSETASAVPDTLTPNEKYFRDAPQRLPAAIHLADDVQYFPAAPHRLIQLAAGEAESKPSKKAMLEKPAQAPPTAAVTTPAPAASAAAPSPLSKQRRQRRAKWSEALQTPANLTIDADESITLGGLLERIQKQHGLPVRVDLAHVLPMTAMAQMTTVKRTPQRSHKGVVKAPSAIGVLPFGVYQTYSAEPVPPVYYPAATPPISAVPYALPAAAPATYAPDHDPSIPSAEPLPAPLQARKPTVEPDDDAAEPPVSAIKAKVIEEPKATPEGFIPPAEKEDAKSEESEPNNAADAIQQMLTQMMESPVNPAVINQPEATVEDILRQAFDRSFPLQAFINASVGEEIPMLTSFTRATEWDLLIQDDGILLTTRLNANLHKETRVYSIKALEKSADLKAEDVARVLTRTVRPWSWKKNFPDHTAATKSAAEPKRTVKSGSKVSIPKIDLSMLSLLLSSTSPLPKHIQLASDDESSITITPSTSSENVELTEEQLELLGRVWDGLFQGTVSSIQVIYHGEPPTGVIEVLPGMLIISQSQGAHREIADFLEQLSQPEN